MEFALAYLIKNKGVFFELLLKTVVK
jgi:hypothetical protein